LGRQGHFLPPPPDALKTTGRIYQLIQDTLRGPILYALPFFD
jgi:hypothetical protein